MAERPGPENSSPSTQPRRLGWRRIFIVVASIVFVLVAIAFTGLAIYFHRAEPILRKRVVDTLATRYNSQIELGSFSVSAWRGFEVTGGGLKVYPNNLDMDQPLFSVGQFSFRINWEDLFRSPMHVGLVHINDLGIHLPPKNQRKNMPKLQKKGDSGNGKIEIVVDRLLIDKATLILGTDKPGKVPLDFEISKLEMQSLGAGQPMDFHAILVNPKPIGDIDSSGTFGPYVTANPGYTPITGSYTFSNADLGTLKGIGGILSSKGVYKGTLDDIVVDGTTDTPDFRLTIAQHPVPLHTEFHAIVDGTNGDTYLQPVNAQILHSHIVAVGKVVRAQGIPGHDITLDVTVAPARIEDMLELGVKTSPPIMTGNLTLHTKFYLPPGKQSVTEKLRLDGNFAIRGAHFTNDKVQNKVDELSLRGQGHAEEAQNGVRPGVGSEMSGKFNLGAQKLTIADLDYQIPGAQVLMNGIYSLDGNQFDFHGKARLQAHVSQLVTGWKSLLLKPVDPFFAKNGAGTEVPIQVTGTRSEPHFGLDFGHKDADDSKKGPQKTQK